MPGVKIRFWPLARATLIAFAESVAQLEVERAGSAAVSAGHKQQRVALRSELVGNLLVGDGVHGCLDLTRRHAGVEHGHVRSEVRLHRVNHTDRANREQTTEKNPGGHLHMERRSGRELCVSNSAKA